MVDDELRVGQRLGGDRWPGADRGVDDDMPRAGSEALAALAQPLDDRDPES